MSDLHATFERQYRWFGPQLEHRLYRSAGYRGGYMAREDVRQEVALAMWEALVHSTDETHVKLKAYRIASRRASKYYTGQTSGWERGFGTKDGLMHERWDPSHSEPHPRFTIETKETLAALRPDHLEILQGLVEGNTAAEIARKRGVSDQVIAYTQKRYIRPHLRRRLKRYDHA